MLGVSSNLPRKAGTDLRSNLVAHDFAQSGPENLQGTRGCTTSQDNLLHFLAFLIGKKILLILSLNFSCFSLCPLSLVLPLFTTQKSPTASPQ